MCAYYKVKWSQDTHSTSTNFPVVCTGCPSQCWDGAVSKAEAVPAVLKQMSCWWNWPNIPPWRSDEPGLVFMTPTCLSLFPKLSHLQAMERPDFGLLASLVGVRKWWRWRLGWVHHSRSPLQQESSIFTERIILGKWQISLYTCLVRVEI